MCIKDLEKVVKKLTGLPLEIVVDKEKNYRVDFFGEFATGLLQYKDKRKRGFIRLNITEIRDSAKIHKHRGIGTKYIFLKVILHEIAHFKQANRYNDIREFDMRYYNKEDYYEDMADRYARIHYKKVLKALNKG